MAKMIVGTFVSELVPVTPQQVQRKLQEQEPILHKLCGYQSILHNYKYSKLILAMHQNENWINIGFIADSYS
jgi:hypothetical protein